MHGLRSYVPFLLYVESGALICLSIRIVLAGLQRVYPFFFLFILAETAQLLIPLLTSVSSLGYIYAFIGTESLIVCLYALIVLELYSKILSSLAGIASLARWYIKVALGIAIAVSLLLLTLENTPTNLVGKFFIFERAIVSSLILFVLLLTAFLVYYPIPLNRNVVVYSIGYAFYFLCKAATLFARNLGFARDRLGSAVLLTGSTLCLLYWMAFLSRAGEKKPVIFGHSWSRGDQAHVLQQLQSINSILLRSARK